jgi:hypothetical protein
MLDVGLVDPFEAHGPHQPDNALEARADVSGQSINCTSSQTVRSAFCSAAWTYKLFRQLPLIEVEVPVVHRRGPAARVARIDAQAERAAGRCLWTHRGHHRPRCPSPAFGRIGIYGRDPRVAPQSGFPLRVVFCRSASEPGLTEVRHSLDGRLGFGGQTRIFGGLDDIFQLERARRLRGGRSARSHDRKIIGLENPGSVCHGEAEITGGVP